jgi:flagellar biosynthesis protein FliP
MKQTFLALLCCVLTGCGMAQSYNQYLDNRQRTFERQQAVLEAANNVRVAQLQVQVAQQQAQVNIAIAKGKAEAQEIQTRSLKPIFVMQELVDAIAAGKVQTLVLPSNAMLPINLSAALASPSP